VGAIWVSLRTGLIHLAIPKEGQTPDAEFALAALLEFGFKLATALDGRPSIVEVGDAALRDALADRLEGLATTIVVADELPAVREMLIRLETDTAGGRRFHGLLESPGVTPDRLRAFAGAAASFYTARPWDHLANEDLIVVDGAAVPKDMAHLCVLGQGGEQFGVSFFESRDAFERVLHLADAGRRTNRAHGVTFGPIDELPFADGDAWADFALPVAGRRAYPLAADLRSDGSVARPDARELAYCEALLRALATTTEDELDAGQWQKRVETFDGVVDLTLTLPYLLEADAERRPPDPSAMRTLAERGSVRLARWMEGRAFESLDEANAEIGRANARGLFDLPPEEAAGRALTPLERAQERAYDAMEAGGRVRIKRAREALAISPDCADAWGVLAEAASTPDGALQCYEQACAAGERAIGSPRFEELTGEFWDNLDTRPYMRARLGLAQTLRQLGRSEEAVTHYRELLRLNPNDNQGVRYPLIAALLEMGRDNDVGALLDEYEGDPQAVWAYARVLWRFRTGDLAAARTALQQAIDVNRHAARYLVNAETIPIARPPHFALGSEEEAEYAADALASAYRSTPGAREWLRTESRRLRSKPAKRTQKRRRK
jgi:tetratricopeptide (TPR) repeat protein